MCWHYRRRWWFDKVETKYTDGISGIRDYIVNSDPKVVSIGQSQVQTSVQCPVSHSISKPMSAVKLPPFHSLIPFQLSPGLTLHGKLLLRHLLANMALTLMKTYFTQKQSNAFFVAIFVSYGVLLCVFPVHELWINRYETLLDFESVQAPLLSNQISLIRGSRIK